ncbi:hypothetical protein ACQP04_26365 [Pseudonocardia halophobica]|uniref:hypothetical protein n=1 Tax=Pseudonocardia halophobica TaxID=29401 RepID=UPI003D8F5FFB
MNGAGIAEGGGDHTVEGPGGHVGVGARTGGGLGVSPAVVEDVRRRGDRLDRPGARASRAAAAPRRGSAVSTVGGEREAGAARGPHPVRPARSSRRARVAVPATGAGRARGLAPSARTRPRVRGFSVVASGSTVADRAGRLRAAAPAPGDVRPVPGAVRATVRVLPGAVSPARYRLRRAVAAAVLALASAAVVVGLGLLAGAAGEAQARSAVPSGTAAVTVEPGESVWDVARRTVPAVTSAGTGAVVERIAADNALPVDPAPLPAGLVLRVPV